MAKNRQQQKQQQQQKRHQGEGGIRQWVTTADEIVRFVASSDKTEQKIVRVNRVVCACLSVSSTVLDRSSAQPQTTRFN